MGTRRRSAKVSAVRCDCAQHSCSKTMSDRPIKPYYCTSSGMEAACRTHHDQTLELVVPQKCHLYFVSSCQMHTFKHKRRRHNENNMRHTVLCKRRGSG